MKQCVIGFAIGSFFVSALFFVFHRQGHGDILAGMEAQRERFEKADERGIPFYTNLPDTDFKLDSVVRKADFNGPVIFNTHLVYSEYFSKEYGYPEEFTDPELPSFVDLMAFDIKSAGRMATCSLKLLIDKDGPVQLPGVDVFSPVAGNNLNMLRVALPERLEGFRETNRQKEYRLNESEFGSSKQLHDIVYRSVAILGEKKNDGTFSESPYVTVPIHVVKNFQLREWSYIEVNLGCSSLIRKILSQKVVHVVVRPRGSGYSRWFQPSEISDFLTVKVPDKLLSVVQADMRLLGKDK